MNPAGGRFRWARVGAAAALTLALAACAAHWPIASADKSIAITYQEVGDIAAHRIAERMAAERRRVRDWWGAGFEGPVRVDISQRNSVSMAMIPAWRGNHGKILLPKRTVDRGTTPTLHELVHIEAPNGNRFLAEGLATYLQTHLGGVDAYPNFGADLHNEVRPYAREANIRRLDTAVTPMRLEARSNFGRRRAYMIAGSFVRFLIETHGKEKFQALYALTPFQPGRRIVYDQDRYRAIYGVGLQELASQWRNRVAP